MKLLKNRKRKLLVKLQQLIFVERKDLSSSEVVQVSRELDKIINIEMKEQNDPKSRLCSYR